MKAGMTRTRAIIAAVAALIAAALLRGVYVLASAPVDDAYITFRYARNLAEGQGFVYNVGERVLGTTTPLFTLLLTPFAALAVPLDAVAMTIGLVADVAACLILFLLLKRFVSREAGVVVAIIYGLFYASAAACGYGMEAPLFQLFVIAAIWLFARRRDSQAAVLAALAALTRPEGYLLAAILAVFVVVDCVRGRRVFRLKPVLLFIVIVAPWLIFSTLYFGSPIPNSLLVKASKAGITASDWTGFFVLRNPVVTLLWCGAAVGLVIGVMRRSTAVLLLGVWAIFYPLFFLAGRPSFLGNWYFAPVTGALVGLCAVAGAEVSGWLLRSPKRGVAIVAILWIVSLWFVLPRSLESTRWGKLTADVVYRPMGQWVADNTDPDAVVQISDIGYVGYLSGRRILDSSALVSPEVLAFNRKHRFDPRRHVRFVQEMKPDILLIPLARDVYTRFVEGGMLELYRPVARFQVQGESDLLPTEDPGLLYARANRYMADFIAYELVQRATDR